MNSLVVSEIKNIKFSNENIFVLEQYFKDYYQNKNFINDIKILPPYNEKKAQRVVAYQKCNEIYKETLKDISESLNKFHKINFSYRSWEIIFGDWLMYFVWILFERYNSFIEILKTHDFKNIYGTKNDNFIFAGNNTIDIVYSSIDNNWNSNLYFRILNYINFNKSNISFENLSNIVNTNLKIKTKKKKISKKIFEKILKIFSLVKFKNDAIVINTYLPLLYEKFFELLLFQTPKLWKFDKINYKPFDLKLRSKIQLEIGREKNVNNFIKSNIKEFLPTCVVESFSDILKKSENAGFPKNPKFIFTSNDFEGNEIFKFYTASLLMKKKTNYFIGQHGNLYFTDLRIDKYRSEFNSCDKFFTWGHSKPPKFKSLFNFSSFGRKKYKFQSKKNLLIVVSPLDYKIYPYNSIAQTESGYKNVLKVLKKVDKEISKHAVIRLNHQYNSSKGKYYFDKYFKNIPFKIEKGERTFVKARCESKLTFFNYDSSGILENLALNYPTICMWNNIEDNINDQFLKDYKILIDAKILFLNKNELAKHLNQVWNNIDEWWLSKNTQDNIKRFNQKLNVAGNYFSLFELKKSCLEKNIN